MSIDEMFHGKDDDAMGKLFSFQPGVQMVLRTKDGKVYLSRFFAHDAEMTLPGIFLRTDDMPERLVFVPWSNISSMESIVLADDE